MHWGKWQSGVGVIKKFTAGEAVLYEVAQLLLTLAVVFVCAHLVKILGETFHDRHSYTQAFTVVAYALSPFFLLRLLDVFPMMNPWVPWGIGIVLSLWIFYQGLPRVMKPDPQPCLRIIRDQFDDISCDNGVGAYAHRRVLAGPGGFRTFLSWSENFASAGAAAFLS